MIKREELADPNSCINKAADDEMVFVLRGKDPAFAATVKFWAGKRVELGLNWWTDDKIQSAVRTADEVARTQEAAAEGGKPC